MDYLGNQISHYAPNIGNPVELDWADIEETFQKIAELPSLDTLLELDSNHHLPQASHHWSGNNHETNSLGEIPSFNFRTDYVVSSMHHDYVMAEAKPLVASGAKYVSPIAHGHGGNVVKSEKRRKNACGRKKTEPLELEDIQKYFDVPITRAAREMKVGVTVLKKRCRELNIMRWPHRKIKSLKSLIHNVKELGMENEIRLLEEHKKLVEKLPDLELTDRTKKLRQACFKANYKKRKSMAGLA